MNSITEPRAFRERYYS